MGDDNIEAGLNWAEEDIDKTAAESVCGFSRSVYNKVVSYIRKVPICVDNLISQSFFEHEHVTDDTNEQRMKI